MISATRFSALSYAGDPGLAEDALQSACRAVAATKHRERIDDLRGYCLHMLRREAAMLYTLRRSMPVEDPESTADPAPPVDETVSVAPQAREWLRRLAGEREFLLVTVPARSGDPGRYRAVIHAAAEQVLRDTINRESSEADSSEAFRAAYPQYFSQPGALPNTLHKRFHRASADVRALLSAVVSRDELPEHPR